MDFILSTPRGTRMDASTAETDTGAPSGAPKKRDFCGTGDPVYWVTGSPPRYCMPFKEGSIKPSNMSIQQFIIDLR